MEKATLKQLLNYQDLANQKVLSLLGEHPHPEALRRMAHLAATRQAWRARILGEPIEGHVFFPEWSFTEACHQLAVISSELQTYLEGLSETEVNQEVDYADSFGTAYRATRGEMLMQVVLHDTHHRGQACLLLKKNGVTFGDIDFYVLLPQLK